MEKRTSRLAIASLVCSLLFIIPILGMLTCMIGIVLGIVALVIISDKKNLLKGEGLAISGIVVGYIGFSI